MLELVRVECIDDGGYRYLVRYRDLVFGVVHLQYIFAVASTYIACVLQKCFAPCPFRPVFGELMWWLMVPLCGVLYRDQYCFMMCGRLVPRDASSPMSTTNNLHAKAAGRRGNRPSRYEDFSESIRRLTKLVTRSGDWLALGHHAY